MNKDVIIVGAGASGLMAAGEVARRGRSVLVIDHMKRTGSKIRISGGGRCNFTNLRVSAENYLSQNRHFCKSALAQFTPEDFIALLDRHQVRYAEKAEGQLFCRRTADDIVAALQHEVTGRGVEFALGTAIKKLRKQKVFEILTDGGLFTAEALVVATGGLSYPELGATNLGYAIAKEFGLKVTRLRPGLVPLLFDKNTAAQFQDLSGTSLQVGISCGGADIEGGLLITHTGLSGPAILQASLYWEEGSSLSVNLLPGIESAGFLSEHSQSRAQFANTLAAYLPRRFAQRWVELHTLNRPCCQFNLTELEHIIHGLQNWKVTPAGTAGFGKAEVTLGGIDTTELSSKTMESKKVPGLYFIGEVLDVTGQLGGYNLQWAWSSGYAAGQHA